jgi:hypothetical protein
MGDAKPPQKKPVYKRPSPHNNATSVIKKGYSIDLNTLLRKVNTLERKISGLQSHMQIIKIKIAMLEHLSKYKREKQ